MNNSRRSEGDLVGFDNGSLTGIGKIRGMSSIGIPGIGEVWILEIVSSNIEVPNDIYPFSCISMSEIHLRSIQ